MARFNAASSHAAVSTVSAVLALFATAVTVTLGSPGIGVAQAAPSDQAVRIEGRTTTLYEGVLRTDGHALATASDGNTPRRCDGTNNGAHTTAGPTPTAAADDAIRSAGMRFDGSWTPGFDDYFVQQFGPDRQDEDSYAYWGILVNGIFTSVGGCQYRLNPDDQTLWVYDAFSRRDLLRLDGPTGIGEATAAVEGGPSTAAVQRSFAVGLGQPFAVTAVKNQATGDIGTPGYRIAAPGVQVAPVTTAADGVQTALPADPATVTTDGSGRATLTWTSPGWKRIKATGDGYVRSNRLDVCVAAADGSGCGALPPDAGPRQPPPSTVPTPPSTPAGKSDLTVTGSAKPPASFVVGGLRIEALRVTTDGHPSGLVGVRWNVLGGAAKTWRLDYRVTTDRKPKWRRAARGTTQLSTLLDLPTGRAVDLRATFTPPSGKPVTRTVGRVVVPLDDRVRQVAISGARQRKNDPLAWRRTVTVLGRGAKVRTSLPAGRPAVVVRSDAKRAVIELRSGSGRWQRLTVRGHRDGRTQVVRGAKRAKTTSVQLRVVSGAVRLDGVAIVP